MAIVQGIRGRAHGGIQACSPCPEMEGIRSPKEGHNRGVVPLVKTFSVSSDKPRESCRQQGLDHSPHPQEGTINERK